MLSVPVTLYTACVLGLLLIFLSANVIRNRVREKVAYGDGYGQSDTLFKAIRAHANFTEYVPLVLIILALLELNNAHPIIVYAISGLIIVGRLLHFIGLKRKAKVNSQRFLGMIMTFSAILVGSISGLYLYFTS